MKRFALGVREQNCFVGIDGYGAFLKPSQIRPGILSLEEV